MNNGIYKVSFQAHAAGYGVIIVVDGNFAGGDSFFYYAGTLQEHDGKALANLKLDRHTPGNTSFFGRDKMETSLIGTTTDDGFHLSALDMAFSVEGERLKDL